MQPPQNKQKHNTNKRQHHKQSKLPQVATYFENTTKLLKNNKVAHSQQIENTTTISPAKNRKNITNLKHSIIHSLTIQNPLSKHTQSHLFDYRTVVSLVTHVSTASLTIKLSYKHKKKHTLKFEFARKKFFEKPYGLKHSMYTFINHTKLLVSTHLLSPLFACLSKPW